MSIVSVCRKTLTRSTSFCTFAPARWRFTVALLALACAQPVLAQTSVQWAQSLEHAAPPWATTWRNSPDEVAQAMCDALGAPQPVGPSNGSYTQSCVAIPNSGHPWPAANVETTSIVQTNCPLPGGCQQSIHKLPHAQMVTRSVTPQFFLSRKQVPNLPSCSTGNVQGDPIVPSTCSVFSAETDIPAQPPATSAFKRYYNSIGPGSKNLSAGWFHSFSRRLDLIYQTIAYRAHDSSDPANSSVYSTPALACTSGFPEIRAAVPNWVSATATYSGGTCTVSVGGVPVDTIQVLSNHAQNPVPNPTLLGISAIRDDGAIVRFLVMGGSIVAPTSVTLVLQQSGGSFTLTDSQDNIESYDSAGRLLSITSRDGRVTTMTYDGQQRLATVTFPFGHTLTLGHDILNRLTSVTDPGGRQVGYGYDAKNRLAAVSNGDGTSRAYLYEDASFPNALTGLIDESNTRLSTWGYDTQGRAISTEEAGGANAVTFEYNADGSVTSTDALGAERTFTFNRYGDRRAVTGISGTKCPTCVEDAATSYDLAGFVASRTDYNGNVTCYAHDSRGLETVRVEGFAPSSTCPPGLAEYTPVSGTRQRKISTTWHATYRLPESIVEQDRTTAFTHYPSGDVHKRTVTDTSVTSDVSRTWMYTYNSSGQVLTEDGPRTDVSDITTYDYNVCTTGVECGQLYTITNALNHVTRFDSYNTRGQPTQITDVDNLLTTSLAYDVRQRLTHRCAGGTLPYCTGGELIHLEYWPTGLLKKVTNPDGSFIEYTYDDAHRLIRIDDALGNHIDYTLDALGNRTVEAAYDNSGTLHQASGSVFNPLNQLWKQVASLNPATLDPLAAPANRTTVFGYDNNGNQTSVNAPLSRNSSNLYDELDRLMQITDPANGVTLFEYDANDNLTSVIDPEGLVTSYDYNGFGDLELQTSPDTGQTSFTYDSGGNLHTRTDARGAVSLATYTYDALNRATQVVYSDRTVTYSYDSCLNGVGRLCGFADAGDSTSYEYDSHGRVTRKTQVLGSGWGTHSRVVAYGYTNGLLTSIQYPSGQWGEFTVHYAHDAAGRVSAMSWTPHGDTSSHFPILSDVQYNPFGAVSGWTWSDGTSASREFDLDGRMTSVFSAGGATIDYDEADRLRTITPTSGSTVPAGSFDYDALDRLTSSTIGGQSQGFTYDSNGNRLTQTGTPSASFTYDDAGGTGPLQNNRLLSVTGGTQRTHTHDAAGNITNDGVNTFIYNGPGRSDFGGWYRYNALGQRVLKYYGTGGSAYAFTYDEQGHLLEKCDVSLFLGCSPWGTQVHIWLGDIPVAAILHTVHYNWEGYISYQNFQMFNVHTDHLNTPRRLNSSGVAPNSFVWRWDSDAFGKGFENGNANNVPDREWYSYDLRFPGQQFDAENWRHYNYFRDYDPAVGRYVQSDPIGLRGGINTYGYVGGSPLIGIDPRGENALFLRGAFWTGQRIGAGINWTIGIATGGLSLGALVADWVDDYNNAVSEWPDEGGLADGPAPYSNFDEKEALAFMPEPFGNDEYCRRLQFAIKVLRARIGWRKTDLNPRTPSYQGHKDRIGILAGALVILEENHRNVCGGECP